MRLKALPACRSQNPVRKTKTLWGSPPKGCRFLRSQPVASALGIRLGATLADRVTTLLNAVRVAVRVSDWAHQSAAGPASLPTPRLATSSSSGSARSKASRMVTSVLCRVTLWPSSTSASTLTPDAPGCFRHSPKGYAPLIVSIRSATPTALA
jgi:hypothetical protein